MVWSSESAPILISGGLPVRPFKLLRTLKKNWFLEVVPDQSVHLSCSMEKETSEEDSVGALVGACTDRVTLRVVKENAAGNRNENQTQRSFMVTEQVVKLSY